MRDLHNNIKKSRGISPVAATTDNTAYVSQILDTRGFDSAEFVWLAGSIADADATFTLLVEESDVNTFGGEQNAVADVDLTNTEVSAAPLFSSDNAVGSIGYIGGKRYIRVTITPAANSGNIFLAGVWLQGNAAQLPVS